MSRPGVGGGEKDEPLERMNTGSDSLTIGKRLRFPAYTTWLPILKHDRSNGKPSTSARRSWMEMMP